MRCLTCALAAAAVVTLATPAAAAPLPNLVAGVKTGATVTVKSFRPDGTAAANLPPTSFWTINDTRVALTVDGATTRVDIRDARTGGPRARSRTPSTGSCSRAARSPSGRTAAVSATRGSTRSGSGSPMAASASCCSFPAGTTRCSRRRSTAPAAASVVANGNDVDLFRYDIWLRNRTTARTRRLTTDHRSRFPALRSDGKVVAYTREHGVCAEGVRASDIVLLTVSTGKRRVLSAAPARAPTRSPTFITNGSLDQLSRPPRSGGKWLFDLVRGLGGDGACGRPLPHSGDVGTYSVSPTQHLPAFERGRRRGRDRRPATSRRCACCRPRWAPCWRATSGTDARRRAGRRCPPAVRRRSAHGVQATATPSRLITPPARERPAGASPAATTRRRPSAAAPGRWWPRAVRPASAPARTPRW